MFTDPSGHDGKCVLWLDKQCAVYQMPGGTKIGRNYSDTPTEGGGSDVGDPSGDNSTSPGGMDEDLAKSTGAPKVVLSLVALPDCPPDLTCRAEYYSQYNIGFDLSKVTLKDLYGIALDLAQAFADLGFFTPLPWVGFVIDAILQLLRTWNNVYDLLGGDPTATLLDYLEIGLKDYFKLNHLAKFIPLIGAVLNGFSIGKTISKWVVCFRYDYEENRGYRTTFQQMMDSPEWVQWDYTRTVVDMGYCN